MAACSPEPVWMIGFDCRTGAVRAARARKISRVYNVEVSSGAAALYDFYLAIPLTQLCGVIC